MEQTAKGTIFTGEIFLNAAPITDHGFIWATSSEPSSNLPKEYKISLGPKSGTGTFSATVSTTLQKTGKYTVKAYITSGQYTVFGTEVDFKSIYGSVAAQILSIQPQRAFLGDTLTIIGKNFNYLNSSNTVRMDDIEAYLIAASDTALQVIVPGTLLKTASIKIKVLTGDQTLVKENAFWLSEPVIHSFSPTTGRIGDIISIWEKFFIRLKSITTCL